jgi:hypothetical protein
MKPRLILRRRSVSSFVEIWIDEEFAKTVVAKLNQSRYRQYD